MPIHLFEHSGLNKELNFTMITIEVVKVSVLAAGVTLF